MAHKKSPKKPVTEKNKLRIKQYLADNPSNLYTAKQIARKLGLKGRRRMDATLLLLLELEDDGHITQAEPSRFKFKTELQDYRIGRVEHVNPRFAFIVSEEHEDDVKISVDKLNNAMDGDVVKVGVYSSGSRGRNPEGEILEIVSRKHKEITGNIMISEKFAFVKPDSKRIYQDIFIAERNINDAQHMEKVLVNITRFPRNGKSPEGEVSKVLGKPGEHNTEIHAIMSEYHLPAEFPKRVEKAAAALPTEISKEVIAQRRDYRTVNTFTIDPIDAKDFDDALSIVKLENGNYEIGIHIADVSHYVEEGSVLDREAFERATSVYLVDRVIPMLPEKISNELCSLRPNEDKLAFSAIFEMNDLGTVKKQWFGRTVIHSDRRFTYEQAQEIIEGAEGDHKEEITILNDIALNLRNKRFKKGAINFETPEVRIVLDEEFKPIGVVPRIRKEAHKLVEEFMLLANRCVAQHVYDLGKKFGTPPTMVYRIHDDPNPEKITTFMNFAKRFGHEFDSESFANSMNHLVEDIEGKPEEHILQNLAIRAMSKARYTTGATGHFGLAFQHYTHFTSPIRRYPDVLVHRLLQHYLDGGKSIDENHIEDQCKHSSEQEKNAADAERTSIKFKQVEYIKQFVGEEFDGVVTGVKDWGFYVELKDTTCEGLVRAASLQDDFYEYDEDNLRLIGRNNKKIITFGDRVRVTVTRANLFDRTIDLEYVQDVKI